MMALMREGLRPNNAAELGSDELLDFGVSLRKLIVVGLFVSVVIIQQTNGDLPQDAQALLDFMKSADKNGMLSKNWTGGDPCASWEGVRCHEGRVWELILESKKLGGYIDGATISRLDQLRRFSLKDNMLSGSIPLFNSSPNLRTMWLSNNNITGPIPDIFTSTPRLHKLDLSYNKISGQIPVSLVGLPQLDTLLLQNNELEGTLPPFNQTTLFEFNISSNRLHGEIPTTYFLQSVVAVTALLPNPDLCGPPLSQDCKEKQSVSKRKGISKMMTMILFVLGDIVFLSIVSLALLLCYRKTLKSKGVTHGELGKKKDFDTVSGSQKNDIDAGIVSIENPTAKMYDKASRQEDISEAEKSKLVVFSRPGRAAFDLEELLRSSAELLGKGNLGTAYKAMLAGHVPSHKHPNPSPPYALVVKRLRDIAHGLEKKEFDVQMLLLGQLQHPNLVPLLAYYFAKDEKFLVYDYVPNGNLFSILHGSHGQGKAQLDWEARFKIAQGIAQGMAYLHAKLNWQIVPNGNLKTTNVLLDMDMTPKIVDYGMVSLLAPSAAHGMAAFKTPEYSVNKDINAQADIYSYGVILLELLTGRFPSHSSISGTTSMELSKWVASIVKEENGLEVLDKDLGATDNTKMQDEVLSVLGLARRCVATLPDERPTMQEVLKLIEEARKVQGLLNVMSLLSSSGSFVTDSESPKHSLDSPGISNFHGFDAPNRGRASSLS